MYMHTSCYVDVHVYIYVHKDMHTHFTANPTGSEGHMEVWEAAATEETMDTHR